MFNPCRDYCYTRLGKQYSEECDETCEYANFVKKTNQYMEENERLVMQFINQVNESNEKNSQIISKIDKTIAESRAIADETDQLLKEQREIIDEMKRRK